MKFTNIYGESPPYIKLSPEEVNHLAENGMQPILSTDNVPLLSLKQSAAEIHHLVRKCGCGFTVDDDPVSKYTFPGKFDSPLPWQRDMLRLIVYNKRSFSPTYMSGAKTSSSYWAIDLSMNLGIANRALVVTTTAGMAEAWINDHFNTVVHRSMVLVEGTRQKKKARLASTAQICVISADSLHGMMTEIVDGKFDCVIVDESHYFKNTEARRTITLRCIIDALDTQAYQLYGHGCKVAAMTGTATGQGVADLAGQAMILDLEEKDMEWYTNEFKEIYCVQQGMGWADNPEMYEEVAAFMQPSFAPKITDIIRKMPIQDAHYVECPMTEVQQAAYDTMRKSMTTSFTSGEGAPVSRTIDNAMVIGNILIQLASGFIYDPDNPDIAHYVEPENTIDSKSAALIALVNAAKSGCLVLGKHTATVAKAFRMASEHCPNAEVRTFNKRLSNKDKKETIAWFNATRSDGKIPVLISQYIRVAESLNLHSGGTTIFMSAVYKMNPAIQVMHRIRRISNKRERVNLVLLHSSALELGQYGRMMQKLERMIDLQGQMVDAGQFQFHLPALLGADGAGTTLREDVLKELEEVA